MHLKNFGVQNVAEIVKKAIYILYSKIISVNYASFSFEKLFDFLRISKDFINIYIIYNKAFLFVFFNFLKRW
ncbi:hypothetical protein SAMN02745912_01875 [Paramaledivibacter caminithermalis DSM 15212]|jgi:hypothetical protein|uniref:Uncharacterized protein n=1 Tax=Paramaledivibacter caminithermalis (strain DSM 15212 / CIP 107654 / DViRD3) TaxID=1121301 RepID=A0A1M6NU97_PARC5|nr:hypothetical protein SAMN02745912_01875 [Paramaledivibacter caminithermalis DSM 15212]